MADQQNNENAEIIIVTQGTENEQKITVVEVVADADSHGIGDVIEAILDPLHEHDTDHPENTETINVLEDHDDASFIIVDPEAEAASHSDIHDMSDRVEPEYSASEDHSHADAAAEAQSHADEAMAAGNYDAAGQFRETAENEAGAAGDSSMLHGSNSSELQSAADHQEQAEYYEHQQSEHAQAGDYEAAREDSAQAASHTSWADQNAGGADHTGQASAEFHQMDWAVWEQHTANSDAEAAQAYAAQGDANQAAMYADNAAQHQAAADQHGDLGQHDGDMAVHDSSSETDHSSHDAYDASHDSSADSHYDSSSHDSHTDSSAAASTDDGHSTE